MKQIIAIAMVVGVLLLVGCSEQVTVQEPVANDEVHTFDSVPVGITHRVLIDSGKFSPADLTIKAGDSVEFVNMDYRQVSEFDNYDGRRLNEREAYEDCLANGGNRKVCDQNADAKSAEMGVRHTITFNGLIVDVELPPGASTTHQFSEKGLFQYFDTYEPGIQGSILVQ
ncbi:TPA: hypothetical protein HA278_04460 [Candidatus Woesearchaeota archaeon]|nr:hypothetical protein [archaeon]HIJ11283.1 hypothetical protein [Candidatus Woesearchaeota archaeon]|tara:strand:- start:194 stop:703 length:510 start_codon:yes stop_codon:yes gene_type:complete